MKALPSSDRRNWQNQALIHQNFCPHGNWLFLPWHRAYLYYFEEICRELVHDDSFALPYWNWTLNRSVPAPFWDDPANNPLFHEGRVATPTSLTGAPTDAPTVNGILDETNFQLFGSGSIPLSDSQRDFAFYGPLEGTPHNYIHGFVGGDMGSFMSPLDPIFWCHHNMIEALWFEWNIRRGNPNPSNPDWTNRVFTEFCDRKGQPVRVSVADTLPYPLEAYQFDPLVLSPSAVARELQAPLPGGDALRAHVLGGAPSELAVSGLSVFGERTVIPISRAASLSTRAATTAQRVGKSRPLIRLSGVKPIATGEVVAHVYVNEPSASASTRTDIPHYVGAVSFFSHAHAGHAASPVAFYLDATRALREGESVSSVQVVPVAYEGRNTVVRQLEIGRIEVGVLP